MTKVTKNNFKLRPELRDSNVRDALIHLHRALCDAQSSVERLIDYDDKDYISSDVMHSVVSNLGLEIGSLRVLLNYCTLLQAKCLSSFQKSLFEQL